jgi:hypothetical protein
MSALLLAIACSRCCRSPLHDSCTSASWARRWPMSSCRDAIRASAAICHCSSFEPSAFCCACSCCTCMGAGVREGAGCQGGGDPGARWQYCCGAAAALRPQGHAHTSLASEMFCLASVSTAMRAMSSSLTTLRSCGRVREVVGRWWGVGQGLPHAARSLAAGRGRDTPGPWPTQGSPHLQERRVLGCLGLQLGEPLGQVGHPDVLQARVLGAG